MAKTRVAVIEYYIMDVIPAQTFHVLVANFLEITTQLPKQMLIAVDGGAQKCVVHMGSEKEI